jgi:transcriptional regulator with XRE-family HTH domain
MNPDRLTLNRYAQREMERLIDAQGIPLPTLRAQRQATPWRYTAARAGVCMTQAQFGDLLGISHQFISSVERGIQPVSARLADLLQVIGARVGDSVTSVRMGDDEERGYLYWLVLRCVSTEDAETCAALAVRYDRHGWPERGRVA